MRTGSTLLQRLGEVKHRQGAEIIRLHRAVSRGFGLGSTTHPREARQAGRANPAGAAHMEVRRFRSSRMLLPEIPGLLADPAASSPGAP